jgi:hypothetical protein
LYLFLWLGLSSVFVLRVETMRAYGSKWMALACLVKFRYTPRVVLSERASEQGIIHSCIRNVSWRSKSKSNVDEMSKQK